jgi:hypothetical protein
MLTFGNGEEPGAVGAADAAEPAGEGGGGVEQLAACRTAAPQEQTRRRNPSSCFFALLGFGEGDALGPEGTAYGTRRNVRGC